MAEEKRNHPAVRRVVTGHDSNKIAKVLIDGSATNKKYPPSGAVATLIWVTDRTPADVAIGEDVEDMGARVLGTAPPPNGTRFTVNDIPPGSSGTMHRTETIDYVIVMSGEIDMEMDDTVVHLKAGDVLVQRGTIHNWVNKGTEPCVIAFVLISSDGNTAVG